MKQVPWSEEAANGLAIAAGDDCELQLIAEDVTAGRAALFDMNGDGYAVVRLDECSQYRECVFVAAQGEGFDRHLPTLEKAAKNWGASRIRAHVFRKGMVRMHSKHGYCVDQYVLKKEI